MEKQYFSSLRLFHCFFCVLFLTRASPVEGLGSSLAFKSRLARVCAFFRRHLVFAEKNRLPRATSSNRSKFIF